MLEILTNEAFWYGVTAVTGIVVPTAARYVLSSKKLTNELLELHKTSTEKDDKLKLRAKAKSKALKALTKYLDSE